MNALYTSPEQLKLLRALLRAATTRTLQDISHLSRVPGFAELYQQVLNGGHELCGSSEVH